MPDIEIWVGPAEARQRAEAGVLMDRNEAFANVLAMAGDERTFAIVRSAFNKLGFDTLGLEP